MKLNAPTRILITHRERKIVTKLNVYSLKTVILLSAKSNPKKEGHTRPTQLVTSFSSFLVAEIYYCLFINLLPYPS